MTRSAQSIATLPDTTTIAVAGSRNRGVPSICRPATTAPTTPITTIDSRPKRRSTATEATASLPRAVRCERVNARAASAPTPAGRKPPTNALTR